MSIGLLGTDCCSIFSPTSSTPEPASRPLCSPLSQGPQAIGQLEAILKIDGLAHVVHTAELAAVPSGLLKSRPVADLSMHDCEIRGALDMVFSGF